MIVRRGFVVHAEHPFPDSWPAIGRWHLHGPEVDGYTRIDLTDLAVFQSAQTARQSPVFERGRDACVMSIDLRLAQTAEEREALRGSLLILVVQVVPEKNLHMDATLYGFYGPKSSVDERAGSHACGDLPLLADIGWDKRFRNWDDAEYILGEYQRQSGNTYLLGTLDLVRA